MLQSATDTLLHVHCPWEGRAASPTAWLSWHIRTSRLCASPTYTMALTLGIHLRNSLQRQGQQQQW